jgi:undecaprenyl-diphosphatase
MGNLQLYELINASPGAGAAQLAFAIAVAQWLIYVVPAAMVLAWMRAGTGLRRDLLQLLLAAVLALALAQLVVHLWPQPRPFALHLGTQYLPHGADPGLPSDHVTVFWSLGIAALGIRRLAVWGLPLLAAGLLVGWSRIYLGVHFPFDILAALPVAAIGAAASRALRKPMAPLVAWLLCTYDRSQKAVWSRLRPSPRD